MNKKKSHYLVRGLFWKEQMHNANYHEAKKDKLCSINKTFEDADLSVARKEAFAYYQSLIDVLYEAPSWRPWRRALKSRCNTGGITGIDHLLPINSPNSPLIRTPHPKNRHT
ncbi:MAG: hypothetical protein J6P73_06900 [Bacteroidales bacterium]|nr:hypothetical protein [Bacteroidales bacterium]